MQSVNDAMIWTRKAGEWQETRADWQKIKRTGTETVTDGLKTNVHGVNPVLYYLQIYKRIGQLCSPQLMSIANANCNAGSFMSLMRVTLTFASHHQNQLQSQA